MAIWIVNEGPDRCGKTTQIELARQWLSSAGVPVHTLKDPSPEVAGDIRNLLLSPTPHHQTTEFLLFMAARNELYQQVKSLENEPGVILCDRYRLSTLVYQDKLTPHLQDTLHYGLGMERDPDAYLLYIPTKQFVDAQVENRWDNLTAAQHRSLGRRYVQMSKFLHSPTCIYEFAGETPEQVFARFTKPSITRICHEHNLSIVA